MVNNESRSDKFGTSTTLSSPETPKIKTVEEVAQKVIDTAFERGCICSKGHYDSFKEEITQDRHSLHTSLVAAVEGLQVDEGWKNNGIYTGGYDQAIQDTLTIINSIFKE